MFQVRHRHHPLLRWVLFGARADDPVTRVRKLVQINLGGWLLLLHILGYNAWFLLIGNPGLMRTGWVQLPVAALLPLLFWLQARRHMGAARLLLMVLGPADALLAMLAGQGTLTHVHLYLLLFALLLPSLTEVEWAAVSGPASAALVLLFLALTRHGWPPAPEVAALPAQTLQQLQWVIMLSCLSSLWCAAMLTELAAAHNEERLQALAHTDPLTGLLNRRGWDHALGAAMRQQRRAPDGLSLGVLDLDHFKRVNDERGHEVGDEVLRDVARCVAAQLRPGDVFARTGGEEFWLLLPGLGLGEAAAVAERIRRSVADMGRAQRLTPAPLTVSIGLAEWRVGETADEALRRADAATYQAKREGRDRVVSAA